jgi:hypothetical protein
MSLSLVKRAVPTAYQDAVRKLSKSKAMSWLAGFQSCEWVASASAKVLIKTAHNRSLQNIFPQNTPVL